MIIFNLILLTLSLILIGVISYTFIIPANNDKKKFRLYALRDELALFAMSGKVNENHEEYKYLIKNINLAINIYDMDFSVTKFMNSFVSPQLSKKSDFERILCKVEEDDTLKVLYHKYFTIIRTIITNDVGFLKHILSVLDGIFNLFEVIKKTPSFLEKKILLKDYEDNILGTGLIRTA